MGQLLTFFSYQYKLKRIKNINLYSFRIDRVPLHNHAFFLSLIQVSIESLYIIMPYSADLARAVLGNLQAQLRSDDFYDVTVYVHATEFRCHRLILCACSKYISDQLETPGSDSVVLTNVSADSFKHVLECIYGAEDVLTDENVSDLWRTAHRLKIDFLFEACEEFILARVSKENCVEIFNLAKSLSSPKVYEEAWNEIVENFQDVYARGELVKLDFEAMFSLVSDENISASSEDSVIAAVSKWIEHCPEITDPEIDNGYGNDGRNTGMMSEHGTDLTTNDRTSFVLELLSSCRLFVVSGNCIQTLAKTK
ncbi:hypothetical protein Btru_039697 [Bulinus truncatus]|nr:hypothetical protein Btru_039697 [Bulinus truncatus]